MGGGLPDLLQYYMGGGSSETPKLYYVIYEQPLTVKILSTHTMQQKAEALIGDQFRNILSLMCNLSKPMHFDHFHQPYSFLFLSNLTVKLAWQLQV